MGTKSKGLEEALLSNMDDLSDSGEAPSNNAAV
jgi:hypothetical protein